MSTKAIKPSGKAIANDIKAANSPSLASIENILKIGSSLVLHVKANSRRSRGFPPHFGARKMFRNSEKPLKDVM